MQEVFEKIIEELEELQNYACFPTEWVNEEQSKIHSYYANKLTEILKLTEQYNNGWVPVSERMPDVCGYPVLLTVENAFGQRRVCKAFTNYMEEGELLFYTNEKEYCQQLTSSILSESWKPIAWMNLPTPYQPKGELEV